MPQSVRYIFKNYNLLKVRLIKHVQRWMGNANINKLTCRNQYVINALFHEK